MPDEEVTSAAEDSGEADAVMDDASASLEQPSALSSLLDSYFAQRAAQGASTFAEAADKFNARRAGHRAAVNAWLYEDGPHPLEGFR